MVVIAGAVLAGAGISGAGAMVMVVFVVMMMVSMAHFKTFLINLINSYLIYFNFTFISHQGFISLSLINLEMD